MKRVFNLKPMEFGDIFSYTFRILFHKFFYFYLLMGWIYIPLGLLYNYHSFSLMPDFGLSNEMVVPVFGLDQMLRLYLSAILYMILLIFLSPLAYAGVIKVVSQLMHGEETSLGGAFRSVFENGRWLRLLAVGVVVSVSTFMGFLAFVLPALLLFVTLSLVPQVVMLEEGGVWQSLSRSWSITLRDLGKVVLVLLVMTILTYIVSYTIGSIITIPVLILMFLQIESALLYFVFGLISNALEVVVAPIPVIAMTLLYYDLRIRREGIDLEKRIEAAAAGEGA